MTAAALKMDQVDVGHSSDELASGTRLLTGQFTIQSFVNSGGFGIVYLATDSLDRRVVVKECFPTAYCRRIGKVVGARSRAQQDDFRSAVRHFVQEAMTLSQLDHPNIVKVHQVFEDNETAYMAMEHIEGHDLLQTVEGSAPPLRPKEIIAHLMTMLNAVAHVHARGLLHRDISPDNMILDQSRGEPVLIDFGASRKEVTRKSRALSGLRVVKDGYSPQEFYVTGSKQGPFSDLYALAASFYHLISGETPKSSQERLSSIAGREGDPLRPLSGRFKAYPAEFLRAIDRAMALFPRDRLQSVEEWRAMLEGGASQPLAAVRSEPAPKSIPATVKSAPPKAETVSAPTQPIPAPVLAQQEPQTSVTLQIPRATLVAGVAAVVLLAVAFAVPGVSSRSKAAPPPRAAITVPLAVPAPVETIKARDALPIVNVLRLPNGLCFEAIDTETGTQTVVSEVPPGLDTTLQPGDVLLVYPATGETLGTATALSEILQREFAAGISTYSFVVQRGQTTMDAGFRLDTAG